MSISVGLQVGHSFFETVACVKDQPLRPIFHQRFYLSQTNLENGLRKTLQTLKEQNPETQLIDLKVSSYLFEKIFETRLGGSVAQFVSEGFEDWLRLRQPVQQPYYDLFANRFEPLGSQENIFPIKERVSSKGEVLVPLAESQILQLVETLKTRKLEKVCLNFMFSQLNNVHVLKAAEILKAHGLQVFYSSQTQSQKQEDEVPRWRKNVLNACLAGSFEEQKNEILKGCEGFLKSNQLFYFDGNDCKSLLAEDLQLTDSLFGSVQLLQNFYQKESEVLFLGLEKWFLTTPQKKLPLWNSVWGPMEGPTSDARSLDLQPTVLIKKTPLNEITFSTEKIGFEPGPMIFGKTLKPTLIDLISITKNWELLKPWIPAQSTLKFEDALRSFAKESDSFKKKQISDIKTELYEHFLDLLSIEVAMKMEFDSQKKSRLLVTGHFAPVLFPELQKRFSQIELALCPYSQEIWSLSHLQAPLSKDS